MSILFSCVFSVVIAAGKERSTSGCFQGVKESLLNLDCLPLAVRNKPTAVQPRSQQAPLSLLDLPPEVMPHILDCMRVPLVWQSVQYPFANELIPFAYLPNSCKALRECTQIHMVEVERKLTEVDGSLFRYACWQPSQFLHSIPRTPDEARDIGVWVWCSLELKMDAARKLSQILQESVRSLDDLSLDGIGAKPHPKRLNPLFAQLEFDPDQHDRPTISFQRHQLGALSYVINNFELYDIVETVCENLCKISSLSRLSSGSDVIITTIMEDLGRHPQKYEQYLAAYQERLQTNPGYYPLRYFHDETQCLADVIERNYERLPPELKQTPDTAAPLSQTSASSNV